MLNLAALFHLSLQLDQVLWTTIPRAACCGCCAAASHVRVLGSAAVGLCSPCVRPLQRLASMWRPPINACAVRPRPQATRQLHPAADPLHSPTAERSGLPHAGPPQAVERYERVIRMPGAGASLRSMCLTNIGVARQLDGRGHEALHWFSQALEMHAGDDADDTELLAHMLRARKVAALAA